MPAPNTPFLLPEIIADIDLPAAVKELLDLYAGPLTADNENNSIPVIVPVSGIRMQNIVDRYKSFETEFQTTFQLWEDLAKRSLSITNLVDSISKMVEEKVYGTDIFMHARRSKYDIENINKELKSVFLALNEHAFNVRHIAWDGYLLTHKRLDELVQRSEYETAFVSKELKIISKDLQDYLQTISWTGLRSGIPAILHTFVLFDTTAHHLNRTSLIDLINLIVKHKIHNPLIPDEMIDDVNTLEKLLNEFLALFNGAINSIYRSEVKQEGMIDAISIYQMILNRLFSASSTGSPQP